MATVRITPRAEEDVIDIWFYIAVENKSRLNGDRFIKQLESQFMKLANSPKIGTRQDNYAKGLYKFPFKNYLIFYFPLNNGIEIIRVLHGARDWPELF